MKEFDLEKAKAGAPLCTRDGDKARIVCYDMKNKDGYHILALIDYDGEEIGASYLDNGRAFLDPTETRGHDLMLADVKHEGWVLVYDNVQCGRTIFPSEERAMEYIETVNINGGCDYKIAHIEWEE